MMEVTVSEKDVKAAVAKLHRERDEADAASVRTTLSAEQQRKQDAADAAASHKAKIDSIRNLEAKRLACWVELQQASARLRDAFVDLLTTTELERKALADPEIRITPASLATFEAPKIAGGRVAEVLSTIPGHRNGVGSLNFGIPGATYIDAPKQIWRDEEAKAIRPSIHRLLTEGESE